MLVQRQMWQTHVLVTRSCKDFHWLSLDRSCTVEKLQICNWLQDVVSRTRFIPILDSLRSNLLLLDIYGSYIAFAILIYFKKWAHGFEITNSVCGQSRIWTRVRPQAPNGHSPIEEWNNARQTLHRKWSLLSANQTLCYLAFNYGQELLFI